MKTPSKPRIDLTAPHAPARHMRALRPQEHDLRARRLVRRIESLHRRTLAGGALLAVTSDLDLAEAYHVAACERFGRQRGLSEVSELLAWLAEVAGHERPTCLPGAPEWRTVLAARVTRAIVWRAIEVWLNVQPRIGRALAATPRPFEVESYFTSRFLALVTELLAEHRVRLSCFYAADHDARWSIRWPEG